MATSDLERQISSAFNSSNNDEDDGLSTMSLIDHLEELRWRIFKCLISVTIFAIVAFIFHEQILQFLTLPLPAEANRALTALSTGAKGRDVSSRLVTMGLTDGIGIYLVVSLVVGAILSLPVILYQTWAFIAPGLYKHEKKNAVPFILIGLVLFLIGISLAYIVLQYPVHWLFDFSNSSFDVIITADSYFKFVALFILVFGVIFEMPLVLTFLARIGIVSAEMLSKKRAMAHVGMWIAACFATPGADLYSPIIIGVSMSCLYELTIIFIRFFVKKDPEAEEVETA